jgi:lipoprotein-releasing system permease protein
MRFELFLALRYLRAKRRQAVVGVVTTISIAGVAAGVAALIIALAITNGMRRDLEDRLVGATAHIDLMRIEADGIRDWEPLIARLRAVPHVTAAAPGIYGQVLVSRGPRAGFALIKGIIPAQESTVSSLLDTITAGSANDLNPDTSRPDPYQPIGQDAANAPYPALVIGNELAEQIGAQVGDSVLVTSPQGELTPLGLAPRYQRFRVAAIFHSGFYQYDAAEAFMRLSDAQRLFSEPDLLSVISFKVDKLDRAPQVARAIEKAAGTFIVIALIVIVAALNILIALTMMVMEKTRDIAVMMSFGVEPGQIRRIFLVQGLLISLIGTALGLVLGYLAAWAGGYYHFIHLSAEVYSIDTLPFAPRPIDGVIVAAVSIGISLLATLYPSSAAARVLPAEALRYE